MLSRTLILTTLLISSCLGHSQTLNPGDLLFTGFSSDDPKGFSFLATDSIPPNTTIYFTDNGWINPGDSLRLGEGFIAYTTSANGLPAGQQIAITHTGVGSIYSASDGVNLVHYGSFNLATSGDQITAFEGNVISASNYTLVQNLAGLGYMNQSGFNASATTANHSAVPPGLLVGQDAVAIPHTDNARLALPTGFDQLSKVQLQSLACNPAHWEVANNFAFQLPPSAHDTLSGTITTSQFGSTAVISGSAVMGTDLTLGELIIPAGCNLHIPTGRTLTLTGDFTTQGTLTGLGTLAFTDTSQLRSALTFGGIIELGPMAQLQTNNQLTLAATDSLRGSMLGLGSCLGSISAQVYLNLSGGDTDGRYYHLGAPAAGIAFADFNDGGIINVSNNGSGSVWQWNAAQAIWEAPASAGAIVERGRGYAFFAGSIDPLTHYLLADAGALSVTGNQPLEPEIKVPLFYNDGQTSGQSFAGGTSVQATEGWNFIANPYPCSYQWDLQNLPTGCNNAIYIQQGSGQFATYINGIGTNGGTSLIAPFQGFWVQTNQTQPDSLVFAQNNLVPTANAHLLKTNNAVLDGIYLAVTSSSSSDQIYIGLDPSATSGFDPQWDAWKIPPAGTIPYLYSTAGSDPLSINRKHPSETSFEVGLKYPANGEPLTLRLAENQLQSYSYIHLFDKQENHWHNLNAGPYNFNHATGYVGERFEIHFSNLPLTHEEILLKETVVIPHPEGFTLMLPEITDVNVLVYNVLGQLIMSKFVEQNTTLIRLPQVPQTYYIQLSYRGHLVTHKLLKS